MTPAVYASHRPSSLGRHGGPGRAQDYVQSLFYGVVLVIAVVLSRLVNRRSVGVS